jgi:hypothetical protein
VAWTTRTAGGGRPGLDDGAFETGQELLGLFVPRAAAVATLRACVNNPSMSDDDDVPVFGTWRRIYAAVVVSALVVMALVALFSRWEF